MSEYRIQVKKNWNDNGVRRMHIQGVGQEQIEDNGINNRPYGMSLDFNVTTAVLDWLITQQGHYTSANNTENEGPLEYMQTNLHIDDVGKVAILVKGNENNNKDGALIVLDEETEACKFLVTFCVANDIVYGSWPVSDDEDADAQDEDTAPA